MKTEDARPATTAHGATATAAAPTEMSLLKEQMSSVLRQRALRDRADAERARHVHRAAAEARTPKSLERMKTFHIPGGSWSNPDDPLSCDSLLDGAWDLMSEWRAGSTWRRYGPAWARARKWLEKTCIDSKKLFCVATLKAYPRLLSALAVWAFRSNTAMTAVETVVLATRMAMRVNGITVEDDLVTKIIREAAKRTRGKMVRKKAGFTPEMINAINKAWGARDQPMAKRMLALAMLVGFLGLLRFSDIRVICISGILWLPEGVVIILPSRKNAQHRPSLVYLADDGKSDGVVARLRAIVTDLTGEAPPRGEGGFMRNSDFLFRRVARIGSVNHDQRITQWVGSGAKGLGLNGYDAYLDGFRRATRVVCGWSAKAVKELGTQSLRAGGDTWLHAQGMTAEQRRDIGQWATPLVERGYLRRTLKDKLAFMRGACDLSGESTGRARE